VCLCVLWSCFVPFFCPTAILFLSLHARYSAVKCHTNSFGSTRHVHSTRSTSTRKYCWITWSRLGRNVQHCTNWKKKFLAIIPFRRRFMLAYLTCVRLNQLISLFYLRHLVYSTSPVFLPLQVWVVVRCIAGAYLQNVILVSRVLMRDQARASTCFLLISQVCFVVPYSLMVPLQHVFGRHFENRTCL